jgi:monoamine oxidase
MPKTPGLRALQQAVRRSLFLQRHPRLGAALEDFQASRGGVSLHDRRAFLKSSLALGLTALPLTALFANCATAKPSTAGRASGALATDPVVILGGGLAGLTAAYRLSRAGVACEVYEAQSRLGGRVFTKDRFNREGMFCELGGELVDSEHAELIGLATELGLKFDDFRLFDQGVEKHQYFFGGRHYYDGDLAKAAAPLVARMIEDLNLAFDDPSQPACTYDSHSPDAARLDRMSLEQYLGSVKELDPWARAAINMAYLTEYGLEPGEQSALNLLTLMGTTVASGSFAIFGESNEAMRVQGGNSRLPEALGRALSDPASKAKLELKHRLVRIKDAGTQLELTFDTGGRTRVVRSSRVICTIPFPVLREIDGLKELGLSPVKRRCIEEMGFGQNVKHMLGFASRHWRVPQGGRPAASGYTFMDLPSQTQWDTSRAQPGKSGILVTFLGGNAALDPKGGSIKSILKDIDAISPGARAEYDGKNAIMRWPKHPYSKGSYACPKVGQYTTLVGSSKETELGGRLLFAGEHVSEIYQGYMNGAIETGNHAAQRILGELGIAGEWRVPARRRFATMTQHDRAAEVSLAMGR